MSKKKKENIDEFNPYEVDKLSKIPSWLIIFVLKFWAAAAAVFFTIIGGIDIGIDFSKDNFNNVIASINKSEQIIVIIGFAISILLNYAVKQVVILLNNRRNNTYKYNLINQTGLLGFFLHLLYGIVVSFVLFFAISFLGYKGWVFNLFGTSEYGIEPFTYGLCFIIIDILCVIIKNIVCDIVERIKYKRQLALDL